MADPPRLLDEGASDFEARLLAAGRKDAPGPAARRRIVRGLGVGGLLSSIALPAKAEVLARLQVGSRSLLVRSALGGTVGAVAVWTGVTLADRAPEPHEERAVPAAVQTGAALARPVPAPAVEPEPSPPEPAAPALAPGEPESAAAKPRKRAATSARDDSRLAEELSHLERARRALAGGEARRTLRLLDEYARTFERPRLGAEASVLRIEALVASGDRARAAQLAKASLARQPNGPYARRLRSLVGESGEPRTTLP